eukprot:25875_1
MEMVVKKKIVKMVEMIVIVVIVKKKNSQDGGNGSDSGDSKNSDNDSSDETAAALFNENKQLKHGENNTTIVSLHFSKETLMNIWILFGLLTVTNIIFCFVCTKRNKGVTRVIKGSSTADNVYV